MAQNQPITEEKELELALKYAWDWFNYHATQRLTAFRFFLIMLTAITGGYITALDKG